MVITSIKSQLQDVGAPVLGSEEKATELCINRNLIEQHHVALIWSCMIMAAHKLESLPILCLCQSQ